MKWYISTTLVLILTQCVSCPEASSQERGFYVSAEIGNISVNGIAEAEDTRFPQGLPTDTTEPVLIGIGEMPFDDRDLRWGGSFGYQINPRVAVEVGYRDLGEATSSRDPAVAGQALLGIEEYTVSTRLHYPLTDKLGADWWLGVSHAQFEVDGMAILLVASASFGPTLPGIFTTIEAPYITPDDELGVMWGFGFDWQLTGRIDVCVNYLKHEVQVVDVETFNVGLVYRFGGTPGD